MHVDLDRPEPLTVWIEGDLTLVLKGDETVVRRMNLASAIKVRDMLDPEKQVPAPTWSSLAWLQLPADDVLWCEFSADDLGWGLSQEDRATLATHGHPSGVLGTLLDVWRENKEPSFSYLALELLHRAALDGVQGAAFSMLARNAEGSGGAARVRKLVDESSR